MIQFIVRRLLTSLVVLVLITLMVFASQRLLPGDPVRVWAGEEQDPESLAFFRHKYGLDQPIPMQYLTWLGLAMRGDLGRSIRTGIEVRKNCAVRAFLYHPGITSRSRVMPTCRRTECRPGP